MPEIASSSKITCFHCGDDCAGNPVVLDGKAFCCEGCKTVYGILNKEGLCDYYSLNPNPGMNRKEIARKDKFSFLDNEEIVSKLIDFKDDQQMQVLLYLPQIHCSSCLWLLENLHKLNEGVIGAKVDFTRKEIRVRFRYKSLSLRELAELLTSIGYEPYISLNSITGKKPPSNKALIYRLGIAGFCFANIMLMSFPEYLGLPEAEAMLGKLFRYLNLLLSLPVFFYSATTFFHSAWGALKARYLNIDAPIALALIVTFARSVYEVLSGTGAGYFDSMSGIVFFMLAGRVLQDRTYRKLSFERDYSSYFPLGVTVLKGEEEKAIPLPDIQLNDTLLIHHAELVPADGILTRGKALIDYSFVTGESVPVEKEMGEIIYAGGKQVGGNIEMLVIREVTQSYLTGLWNRNEENPADKQTSFVETISRYFTLVVLAIAFSAALFWYVKDQSVVWNAVTAVLIVACPCALLLCHTFTNGNMLRLFSRKGLYLRNAAAIERMAGTTFIVFDKTGTLTSSISREISFEGNHLCSKTKEKIAALAAQSTHPLSKSIVRFLDAKGRRFVNGFRDVPGQGIEGIVEGDLVSLGSARFVLGKTPGSNETSVYVSIENKVLGRFVFRNEYRQGVQELVASLKKQVKLAVLSGDNDAERPHLEQLLGPDVPMHFKQQPSDKLHFIQQLRARGENVMMVGDGLNDAPSLRAADTGIAITDDTNLFTPASDAILEGKSLGDTARFICMAKASRRIILSAFAFSILYNIVGIAFAVSGLLSPMIAAILMPASSISILLITYGCTSWIGRRKHD